MEEITVKPTHIAIIMDGNGRWATRRGMERPEGHKAGAESVRATLDCCCKYGIKYLTLYAFSTENWKRSSTEVGALMKLLSDFLDTYGKDLVERKIRLRIIGDIDRLPWPLSGKLKSQIKATEQFSEYNLTIALSYGSRAEIAGAAKKIAAKVKAGELSLDDIDEATVAANLQTADIPDPDLIIRTAGEQRLSNFLLWQASYSEFLFLDTLWPDFREPDFLKALEEFSKRQRRYGNA
ncbi:MAG: di-trans,poly-cis-decaprenylcistransferase [Victivallales bacterium]|nr:di-trans,poly-cis-decaprenylcistransferase [Victivallales bacterium]